VSSRISTRDLRAGVHRVADALVDGGARVERHSPLLPDLTEAATLYTQLLFSGSVAHFPVEAHERLRIRAAGLSADDQSLDAARLRGMVFSHRDWLEANNRRELHRHGWRQLFAEFDAVVCPITPTPAFPHDHNPDLLERRIGIDGVGYPYFDQLVWAGLATMPGLPATAIPAGRSTEVGVLPGVRRGRGADDERGLRSTRRERADMTDQEFCWSGLRLGVGLGAFHLGVHDSEADSDTAGDLA
jgi:Asp-tRNA(Asn)/Glu-tRNA(Gln) amidotransferase A subunit family amidase